MRLIRPNPSIEPTGYDGLCRGKLQSCGTFPHVRVGSKAPLIERPVLVKRTYTQLQACEELGIGFVPYSPLGKGFLTGTMNEKTKLASNDFRSILPRFTPEAMKANQTLVDLLGRIAKNKNATPAQIAIAWLLGQ